MGKKRNQVRSSNDLEQPSLERKNAKLAFILFVAGEMMLFGILFKKYYDLGFQFSNGPIPEDIFPLYFAVTMMTMLLLSQYTCWKAIDSSAQMQRQKVKQWFTITILLSVIFLGLLGFGIGEYMNQPINPFVIVLKSILTLHGIHVVFGMVWIVYLQMGLKMENLFHSPRFYMIHSFWQFIVVSGIIIYTFVYALI